jgi:DNA-binding SARP family transcriptional activator
MCYCWCKIAYSSVLAFSGIADVIIGETVLKNMIHEVATKVSLEDFRQLSAGKKVILLYPWTNYRTLFLAHFVAGNTDGLLYYRIADGQDSLTGWLTALDAEFKQRLNGFDGRLSAALASTAGPAELGEALAADLGTYAKKHNLQAILYVDELDRIPFDSAFNKFVRALIGAMPENAQFACSSRLLTYQPWYDFVTSGEAVVLGTEYRKDDGMFTIEENPRPQVEVYALGRGFVLVNGQPITNWDGALPRNLFFYFMDHALVTRDEIFATFWPELSIKEATNVFHVTKRKISERISNKIDENGSYELTQYSAGFYVPSQKVIRHYDVGDFQAAIERAMITTDEAEEERLLSEAIDLYRAPYLQDTHMDWMDARRDNLRQLSAQALIGLGRLNKRRGDNELALGFFQRSLKETPEREDIHREIMSLYLKLGRAGEARRQYQELVETLRKTLNISPSRETQDLYRIIEAQM